MRRAVDGQNMRSTISKSDKNEYQFGVFPSIIKRHTEQGCTIYEGNYSYKQKTQFHPTIP